MKYAVAIGFFLLAGCASTPKTVQTPAPSVPPSLLTMYEDTRAFRVGDLVTIEISESARGFKQNRSKAEKNAELAADFEGNVGNLGSKGTLGNNLSNAALKTKNKYDGESGLEKKNTLEANVTATIISVLPSGNLLVKGEQQITLDRGAQTITVEGTVRPEDVSSRNTVSSTRIANARIKYKSAREPDVHRFGLAAWVFNWIF